LEPWDDLEEAELPELKIILDGILNQGAKMTLGSSSKAGKTWLLMDLAFSIATGRDWLGIKTHKGKVLYVNFEIQKQFFRKRGQSIRRAKGIPPKEKIPNLRTWTLRGKFMTAEDFKNAMLRIMTPRPPLRPPVAVPSVEAPNAGVLRKFVKIPPPTS
jgi:RecA-family ATPase